MKRLVFFLLLASCAKQAPPPPRPTYVTATQVQKQNMPSYLEYVGHIEAYNSVDVKPQISGIITDQHFIEGQEVKAGDLLFTIDQRPFEAALAKAEAGVAQATAALKYAETTVKRYSPLVQDEYVSRQDYDQFLTNLLESEAVVKQNLADLQLAKINLEYCTIKATMNGIASITNANPGNFVQPGDSTPLMVLNQIAPIYATFGVPEKDISRIQEKQAAGPLKVTIYLDEDRETSYEGSLSIVNNQVDTDTGTLTLKATFPNDDRVLWPGEFAIVRVTLETLSDALIIPTQAVLFGPDGPYVWIVKPDETVAKRQITLGQSTEEITIVESGLVFQDTVVLEGQLSLHPGTAVQIKRGS